MRILIIDNHPVFRLGLRRILRESFQGLELDEIASTREIGLNKPAPFYDLLILGTNPYTDDSQLIHFIRQFKAHMKNTKIMVILNEPNPFQIRSYYFAEINGLISKRSANQEIVEEIRNVILLDKYIGTEIIHFLREETQPNAKIPGAVILTGRQKEIALLVSMGKTIREIAYTLSLKVSTISTQKSLIFKKVGVRDPTGLKNKGAAWLKISF